MLFSAQVHSRAAAWMLPFTWMAKVRSKECSEDRLFHAACPGGTLTSKEAAKLMWMLEELEHRNGPSKEKRKQGAPGPKRKWLQRKQNRVRMLWSEFQVGIRVVGRHQAWPRRQEVPMQESYSWAQTLENGVRSLPPQLKPPASSPPPKVKQINRINLP